MHTHWFIMKIFVFLINIVGQKIRKKKKQLQRCGAPSFRGGERKHVDGSDCSDCLLYLRSIKMCLNRAVCLYVLRELRAGRCMVLFFFFCYTFRCVEGGSGRWVAAALTRVERTKTAQVCKYMYVHISVCIYLYRPHKPVVRSSV